MGVLVGRQAPDFTLPAVMGDGSIKERFHFSTTIRGRYALLFFYPLDFSFVCPSELLALDHRLNEFKKRHVEVIAVSVDSHFTHTAWRNTPVERGGIGPVGFTMAADMTHSVCCAYDVESTDRTAALRAAFLVDTEGVVRYQAVNDTPLGRDIDEILRVVDALQYCDEHGELCPAGWHSGDPAIKDSVQGVADYLSKYADKL